MITRHICIQRVCSFLAGHAPFASLVPWKLRISAKDSYKQTMCDSRLLQPAGEPRPVQSVKPGKDSTGDAHASEVHVPGSRKWVQSWIRRIFLEGVIGVTDDSDVPRRK